MAQYTILYWQDIPSVVEARVGRKRSKIQLSERFQELIDSVAMRKGLFGTDEYLEHWRKGQPRKRDGAPDDVASAVASEIEADYDQIETTAMSQANEARRQANLDG